MMKRGSSTVECIDIPDVKPRLKRTKWIKRAVKKVTVPKVVKVVKSLEQRKKECRLLLNWRPQGKMIMPAPRSPLEPTFSEVPLARPKPDCMAGASAPAAPAFSTKFGTRHTIPYPFTHKWTVSPEAAITIWNFDTVNRAGVKQIAFAPGQDQSLLLTKEQTLGDLPRYGSIDVTIHSESACGMKSPPVKMIICDTKVHISPNIDGSSDRGDAGGLLKFFWAEIPADQRGHMFKLTWYTKHNSKFQFTENVSR